MINFSPFFSFFICCAFSLFLSLAASRFIDHLYRKNAVPARTSRLRPPFLPLVFWVCGALLLAKAGGPSLLPVAAAAPIEKAAFPLLLPVLFLLVVITVTDWEQRLIFNDATLLLAFFGLARSIAASYEAASCVPLLEHLAAAVAGGLPFLLLALLTKGGVGGGDVKLIAALGLWFGPARLADVVFSGVCFGGGVALILLLTGLKQRKDTFAYGPFFTLSALYFLLVG